MTIPDIALKDKSGVAAGAGFPGSRMDRDGSSIGMSSSIPMTKPGLIYATAGDPYNRFITENAKIFGPDLAISAAL